MTESHGCIILQCVVKYAVEVTVLKPGWTWSNVCAGQGGNGEEG